MRTSGATARLLHAASAAPRSERAPTEAGLRHCGGTPSPRAAGPRQGRNLTGGRRLTSTGREHLCLFEGHRRLALHKEGLARSECAETFLSHHHPSHCPVAGLLLHRNGGPEEAGLLLFFRHRTGVGSHLTSRPSGDKRRLLVPTHTRRRPALRGVESPTTSPMPSTRASTSVTKRPESRG